MPAPESTPALDALRMRLIAQVHQAFDEYEALQQTVFALPIVTPAAVDLPPGKIDRAVLFDVISSHIDDYIEDRHKYNIKDFRKYCEPALATYFRRGDLEPGHNGLPKWYDRFGYAHRPIAERRGYIGDKTGVYTFDPPTATPDANQP